MPAPMVRNSRIASTSVEANPWDSPMAMGKNVYIATTLACEVMPNPNQITTKGAMATIGNVWETTKHRIDGPAHPIPAVEKDRYQYGEDEGSGDPEGYRLDSYPGVAPDVVPVAPGCFCDFDR